MPDGNELQNARVYAAIAEAAVERYASENPVPRRVKIEWGVIASLLLSAFSAIFTAGFMWGQVQKNTADIQELRVESNKTTDRLARIETKLDVLIDVRGLDSRPAR